MVIYTMRPRHCGMPWQNLRYPRVPTPGKTRPAMLQPTPETTVKIVYKAADILEAHIVSGMLAARGIEAYVAGHYLQGAVGDLPPFGLAHVSVPDDDFDAALTVIKEYESGTNQLDDSSTTKGG